MTTKIGRKKLNFLNRKDEITHALVYGDDVPDLNDTLRTTEELTELLSEAAQEGWGDMADIVMRDLSHWMNVARDLQRAAQQQEILNG